MKYYLGNNLFDGFFGGSEFKQISDLKTDITEKDGFYQLDMEVPGINKEDIHIELKNGYLTVSASKNKSEDTEEDGRVIRRERFTGSVSRSFFVGHQINAEDVDAKFEDGELKIMIPVKQKEIINKIEVK